MSADNGIYIINFKDQSRVIHAQAIDNLNWSFINFKGVDNDFNKEDVGTWNGDKLVPTRIVEYFQRSLPMWKEDAQRFACDMADEILSDDFCPVLEYGICEFDIDKTWNEIVEEAKKLAPKEIAAIKTQKDWDKEGHSYIPEIEILERIINS